jgi:hypothetical protein
MKFGFTLYCTLLLAAISACDAEQQPTPSTSAADTNTSPSETIEPTADPTELPPTSTSTKALPTPTEFLEEITFAKTFGGDRRDRGINLLQTSDGGYAIIGYTSSHDAKQEDVYLVRTDVQGEMLWSMSYGGEGRDNGWDILELGDGGFLVAGFTNSFGAGEMDILLVRTNANGILLWERTFGGPRCEFGWALAPTADGGFVLAGQTNSFGEGEEDGYIVKVNAEGEEIWNQTFGGQQEDRLFSIDQSADLGFILTGTTRSMGSGNRDLYLVKTDETGELS